MFGTRRYIPYHNPDKRYVIVAPDMRNILGIENLRSFITDIHDTSEGVLGDCTYEGVRYTVRLEHDSANMPYWLLVR
jgi:hypothetical protein